MRYKFKFKKAGAQTQLAGFDKRPSWKDLAFEIATLFHISSPNNVGVAFVERRSVETVEEIQVTVGETHKDSEAAFYSRWSDWQEFFGDYKLKTNFVWIVEDKQSWQMKEEEIRTTRNNSKLISPEHEQIVVTVRDINITLGGQLAAIRR